MAADPIRAWALGDRERAQAYHDLLKRAMLPTPLDSYDRFAVAAMGCHLDVCCWLLGCQPRCLHEAGLDTIEQLTAEIEDELRKANR